MNTLVTYCSRFGSTAQIAERIAAVIRREDHLVDLRPLEEVTSIASYDAVVVGSGVHDGRWPEPARTFVRN
jgi:menaquinone-dependent protoporphyrinogen oxidase